MLKIETFTQVDVDLMLKIETFTQVDVDEVDGVPLDVDGVPLAKDVDGEPLADEEEEDIFNMSPKKSFVSLEFKEVPIVFTLITLNLCRVLSLEVHVFYVFSLRELYIFLNKYV